MKNRIPDFVPVVAAAIVSGLGIVYALNIPVFFDLLHWYSFSADHLLMDDYNRIVHEFGIVQLVYYMLFIPLGMLSGLRKKRSFSILLITISLVRLMTLVPLCQLGEYLIFQLGFACAMEIYALGNLILMSVSEKTMVSKQEKWLTVGLIGVIAEAVPLIQNTRLMFVDGVDIKIRIMVMLLPLAFAAMFFIMTYIEANPYGVPSELMYAEE